MNEKYEQIKNNEESLVCKIRDILYNMSVNKNIFIIVMFYLSV